MTIFVTTEQHFIESGDVIYTTDIGSYLFWQRYLNAFDEVVVVARIKKQMRRSEKFLQANGDRVRFFAMPDYIGSWQFLRTWPVLLRKTREIAQQDGAFILRVPGAIGSLLWYWLKRYGKPFAVEVVGDPYDSLSPKALQTFWAYLIRPLAVRWLKAQCHEARWAAYVTREALQRRYPPGGYNMFCSDVNLGPEAIANEEVLSLRSANWAQVLQFRTRPWHLCFVGTLARLYKAPDILLEAAAICLRHGFDLRLTIVGDGRYRAQLEAQANRLGLNSHVYFLGYLPAGDAVRAQLDQADLFVLPSKVEGLPRAMIEAMARGLPCIGSTAGGIPELLPPEDLVPPGDPVALAHKIREVLTDPARMARMAERNFQKAQEYREEILRERRIAFYRCIKQDMEEWQKVKGLR